MIIHKFYQSANGTYRTSGEVIVCLEHNMEILRIDETATIMTEEAKAHINRSTANEAVFVGSGDRPIRTFGRAAEEPSDKHHEFVI